MVNKVDDQEPVPMDEMASSTVNQHTEALSKILAEMQPTLTKDQSEFDLLDLMEELS